MTDASQIGAGSLHAAEDRRERVGTSQLDMGQLRRRTERENHGPRCRRGPAHPPMRR